MVTRLQDIADDVGVSKVTVSKVLRGSPDVGEQTRRKIKQRMLELNYQPNYQARALAGGKTFSIGLVVPDLVHPFFAEIAKGLSSMVRESGRVLLLGSSEEDPQVEQQQVTAFLQRGVDAILVASCQQSMQPAPTQAKPVPCVLVDRSFPGRKHYFVGSDDYRVGTIATEHLIQIGRKHLAHIGSDAASTGRERLRAFHDVAKAAGLRIPERFVLKRERFEEAGDRAGYEAMRQMLAYKQRPDAVFCYNDLTAIGAMAATMAAGLRIPEDIAFVGCGNFRYADFLQVPLTSVDQSAQAIGAEAGKLAMQLIAEAPASKRRIYVEPTLVVRGSSVQQFSS